MNLHIISKYIVKACLLIIAAGLCNCNDKREKTTPVARESISVSIPVQKWIVDYIAPGEFDVNVLLPPGSDPETFEPSMAAMVGLAKSDTWFMAGELPFESMLVSRLTSLNPDLTPVALGEGEHDAHGHDTPDLHTSHKESHGHSHDHCDPHVWTSASNLLVWSDKIYRRLAAIRPQRAREYAHNRNRLDAYIKAVDDSIRSIMSHAHNVAFMIWHPTLEHWAQEYDVQQIAIETEGKETTPADMAAAVRKARESGAKVLIVEKEHNPQMALTLNRELNLRTVEISVMEGDAPATLLRVAREITR